MRFDAVALAVQAVTSGGIFRYSSHGSVSVRGRTASNINACRVCLPIPGRRGRGADGSRLVGGTLDLHAGRMSALRGLRKLGTLSPDIVMSHAISKSLAFLSTQRRTRWTSTMVLNLSILYIQPSCHVTTPSSTNYRSLHPVFSPPSLILSLGMTRILHADCRPNTLAKCPASAPRDRPGAAQSLSPPPSPSTNPSQQAMQSSDMDMHHLRTRMCNQRPAVRHLCLWPPAQSARWHSAQQYATAPHRPQPLSFTPRSLSPDSCWHQA
jgi:hypothetical protein